VAEAGQLLRDVMSDVMSTVHARAIRGVTSNSARPASPVDHPKENAMLRSLNDLEQYSVRATDGDVGTVVNFLVDDESWTVRYLVVEIGDDGFPDRRRVLISPISFHRADWPTHRFELSLTSDKIRNSPSIDVDKPISRQREQEYRRYYDYPDYLAYSGSSYLAYSGPLGVDRGGPALLETGGGSQAPTEPAETAPGDIHLRSAAELRDYHIQGLDGAIGHVEDFLVDDDTWEVCYLVVATSNWWFGKKVLVAPRQASRISWEERRVYVELSRQGVKDSPQWHESATVYGEPVYWAGSDQPAGVQPVHHSGAHRGEGKT